LNDSLPDGATPLCDRFDHRLVSIHPFPNGNGRHARLIADGLIEQLGAPRFSWGGSSYLVEASTLRQRYIAALQQGWCRWEWESRCEPRCPGGEPGEKKSQGEGQNLPYREDQNRR